ncbi:hypothetical protein VTN77DRAFT_3488 [Rasamsonia byssochlamydoides]|uniref:uncharacterized protein n=1 Tax=Rasamsonia byssochlamydoides TaxID=89139 RepID=UPI003741FE28
MDGPGNHTNPFRNPSPRRSSGLTLRRQRAISSPASSFDTCCSACSESMERTTVDQEKNSSRRSHHHHHRHQQRMSRVNPDIIDQLDNVSAVQYHHEGPYDAVYPERNRCSLQSPIDALKESNEETLRATPMYKIMDSIRHGRPLDGVAFYPPGTTDPEGHTYQYTEGDNMMTEIEGNFIRSPGMKFTDEDFKNDPFYQDRQRPRRMGSLRKALGFKGRSRKNTA